MPDISYEDYTRRYRSERERTKDHMRKMGVKDDIISDWERRTAGKGSAPPTATEKAVAAEEIRRKRARMGSRS